MNPFQFSCLRHLREDAFVRLIQGPGVKLGSAPLCNRHVACLVHQRHHNLLSLALRSYDQTWTRRDELCVM